MTQEELEGRYESPRTLGPGTRYLLELDGPRAGAQPGERFSLVATAWALTGQPARGLGAGDRPEVEVLGRRRLEGAWSLDGAAVVLEVRQLTDTPGDGLGGAPAPVRRSVSETIRAEVVEGARPGLRFRLYGSDVSVSRV